jgi:hypothetical protein
MTNTSQFREIYFFKHYYLNFFNAQSVEVKVKFNWTLNLISTIEKIPTKYFQYIVNSDGLYEIRVQVGNNIFRRSLFLMKAKLLS